MSYEVVIFGIVFIVAVAVFGWSCYRRFRLVALGKPENRFGNVGRRIGGMLIYP
ncbi:MAG TPA: hypothetical protein G4O09_00885, partial [Dehalococcoidia bacterium]|nr:hypothetical protein [Dehalococcoidia bacterium]